MNDFQENMFKILFLTTYFKVIKIDENKLLFIYFVNNFVNNNRSIPNHLTCKKKKKKKFHSPSMGFLVVPKPAVGRRHPLQLLHNDSGSLLQLHKESSSKRSESSKE